MWSSFSLWVGFGASVGLAWAVSRAADQSRQRLADAGLLVLLGALLGARAGFVLAHDGYFQSHLLEAPQFWLGGLSWPGAAVGALLAFGLACLVWRLSPAPLADGLLPLALPVLVCAWLGAWQAGSCYGPLSAAWYALPSPDESGALAARIPLSPAAALLTLILFALLDALRPRLAKPGLAAALTVLGLGVLLLGAGLLRADPSPVLGASLLGIQWSLRPDAWAALALSLLGFAACLFTLATRAQPPDPAPSIPL